MTDVDSLSVRLARLACDLDEVVQAIAAGQLTEGDTLLLGAPAAHLALAATTVEVVLWEVDTYGENNPPPILLTRAAGERRAASSGPRAA